MINLQEEIKKIKQQGYSDVNAQAKLSQDIFLGLIAKSSLRENVTIKGGVVMRSISGNIRRATQDIDIDFIKYSLDEKSIRNFIKKISSSDGITIDIVGVIEELKQQDYHGKRANVIINDYFGNQINSKIDFGVHNNLQIDQEEYCFDVAFQEGGVSLLINSKEQMLTEKLRSILKFGNHSTRFKDVYDIYYLASLVDKDKLRECLKIYILYDSKMKENSLKDIVKRIEKTFSNNRYKKNLRSSRKNWLNIPEETVMNGIIQFFREM